MMKKAVHTCPEPLPKWDEAEVIDRPQKAPAEPTVLVRRRRATLTDAYGNELQSVPGLPTISLFSGIGGFEIGMERSGFVCLCQHEWDQFCCQTLVHNRPNFFRHAALIQGNIYQTPTEMILREAGLRVGECHIVTGGPPCQGFSVANSRRGKKKDGRNDLVFEFLRCVREIQPHFFIMENVPGFCTLNNGAYIEAYLSAAYGCYYELVYGLVNCAEYGVPQDRCRFICMGTRRDLWAIDGQLGALPAPECFGKSDIITLEREKAETLFTCGAARELRRAPGIRYFPDRPVLRPPNPSGEDGRSKTFLEFYRRIEREEPDRLVFSMREAA